MPLWLLYIALTYLWTEPGAARAQDQPVPLHVLTYNLLHDGGCSLDFSKAAPIWKSVSS